MVGRSEVSWRYVAGERLSGSSWQSQQSRLTDQLLDEVEAGEVWVDPKQRESETRPGDIQQSKSQWYYHTEWEGA